MRILESNPATPREERKELAWSAWMAAAERLKPEVFALFNEKIDEINAISAEFDVWWKKQIAQCIYIIADRMGDGYLSCVLQRGHEGDHRGHCQGDVLPDASWILPEQLAWRHRRSPR